MSQIYKYSDKSIDIKNDGNQYNNSWQALRSASESNQTYRKKNLQASRSQCAMGISLYALQRKWRMSVNRGNQLNEDQLRELLYVLKISPYLYTYTYLILLGYYVVFHRIIVYLDISHLMNNWIIILLQILLQ